MRRLFAAAVATTGALLAWGAPAAFSQVARTDVILANSKDFVDYHAEAAPARPADGGSTIIGGNIHIKSDRGARGGVAGACDPDPRADPHTRPDDPAGGSCAWMTPAGAGEDFIAFGRHIQNDLPKELGELPNDTDTSPNGAFTPVATDTRESFNGRGGLDDAGALFMDEREVIDDEDLNFRIVGTRTFAYQSPQGNADNRWRRLCGEGVVEQLKNNTPISAPFVAGQTRQFVVQIWDADFKDPSNQDGGNQDYFIIDVLRPDVKLDETTCQIKQVPNNPPNNPEQPNNPQQPEAPVTPSAPAPVVPAPVAPAPAPVAAPPAAPAPRPQSAVQGEQRVAPGTARIAGARTCPTTAFLARVTGRRIRQVTFTIDGRRLGTVRRADAIGRWKIRVNPRGLRTGTHRVRARVQFVSGAGNARTLTMSFRTCAAPAAQAEPNFTG